MQSPSISSSESMGVKDPEEKSAESLAGSVFPTVFPADPLANFALRFATGVFVSFPDSCPSTRPNEAM